MKVKINKKSYEIQSFKWGDICRLADQGIKISDFASLSPDQMTLMYLHILNKNATPDNMVTQQDIEELPLGHPLFSAETMQMLLDSKPEKKT